MKPLWSGTRFGNPSFSFGLLEDWRVSFMQHEHHAIVHMAFMQGWQVLVVIG